LSSEKKIDGSLLGDLREAFGTSAERKQILRWALRMNDGSKPLGFSTGVMAISILLFPQRP